MQYLKDGLSLWLPNNLREVLAFRLTEYAANNLLKSTKMQVHDFETHAFKLCI